MSVNDTLGRVPRLRRIALKAGLVKI